jgi:hypothetical protein
LSARTFWVSLAVAAAAAACTGERCADEDAQTGQNTGPAKPGSGAASAVMRRGVLLAPLPSDSASAAPSSSAPP